MTDEGVEEAPYTTRAIQETLGLTRGVIAGLVAAGFVTPRRGPRKEYRFTFRDVVLLRTAVDLQAAAIAPRRIVSALKQLRARLPAELPLSGLRITAVGSEVTVRDAGAQWQAESGQQVLDFELTPARGNVAFLQRRGAAAPATPAAKTPLPTTQLPTTPLPGTSPTPRRAAASAAAWFAQGVALEASEPAAAEAAYRRALALDAELADAYLNLGAMLCEASRCDEAVALYDEAVRRRPREALLHFNRAIALEDQGRVGEALAAYDASLALAPELADAHYNAARLHEQLGDRKQAVRHLSAYRRLQR